MLPKIKNILFDPHETKEILNIMCDLESLQFRRQSLSPLSLSDIIHNHPDYLQQFNITLSSSARRPNKLVFAGA